MKFIKIPANRWLIAALVGLGVLFGNDAVVAILRPIIDSVGGLLPAG